MAQNLESSSGGLFPRISIAEIEGTATSVRHRQDQFRRLHTSLLKTKSSITESLRQDYGYTEWEAGFEYLLALSELRDHYESIDFESEKAAAKSIEEETESTRVAAAGIVYIIPETRRNGFYATISPLSAAMAAGNCVIVELQQTLSRTTSLLRQILADSLSHDTFAISDRRADEQFLSRCCVVSQSDTGTTNALASAQMTVTSPHSSPAVLFVDRTADLKLAARCTVTARFGFHGSSSCAPNAVLVHEAVERAFSAQLLELLEIFLSIRVGSKDSQPRIQASQKGKGSQQQNGTAEMEVLFSNASVEVVVVRNRPHRAYQPPTTSKSPRQSLILYTTTSLDHAIDLATEISNPSTPTPSANTHPAAALIYASPPSAQYIANSIDALFTCVNTVPTELLVGPRIPRGGAVSPRYSKSMFSEPRPVMLKASALDPYPITSVDDDSERKFRIWKDLVQQPLRATGQRPGKRMDFFIQGLITGSTFVSITLILGFGMLVNIGYKKLWLSRVGSSG